jgi:hypothetical protein
MCTASVTVAQRNLARMATIERPTIEGRPGGTADGPVAAPRPPRLRWWKEAIFVVAFYMVYSFVRNLFGSAQVNVDAGEVPYRAFSNARRVISLEKALGIYHELTIQQWFLPASGIGEIWIRFWNVYYGSFHFVITIIAFVWLFRRMPHRFPRYRNALAFTTGFALIGFSLFPLMPPRLLDKPTPRWGGAVVEQQHRLPPFGYVDTLEEYGGLWNFDSGAVAAVSNQYAAMPSLHIGWSVWCAMALWPLARKKWARFLLILYPLATLFCIVVTANHYLLDGFGGLVILFSGYWCGRALDQWNQRRVERRLQQMSVAAPSTA